MLFHPFSPLYNEESKILVLGTFPSVLSRKNSFYYGNPQNRFWKVIAKIGQSSVPCNIYDKKELLLQNHIALWDIVKSCNICGSNDATIKDVTFNDIFSLLKKTKIKAIFANGNKANELLEKYKAQNILADFQGIYFNVLPSTSSANAKWSEEKLIEKWKDELKKVL